MHGAYTYNIHTLHYTIPIHIFIILAQLDPVLDAYLKLSRDIHSVSYHIGIQARNQDFPQWAEVQRRVLQVWAQDHR